MILEKMERIIEKGYDLNMIALLYMCKQGDSINSQNAKIQAILAMMERKGIILEGRITASGEELLAYVEDGEKKLVGGKQKIISLEEIYDRVAVRIEELTGKKQVRSEIFGKTYNYLPVKYDFTMRLKKVINKYSLTDVEKVEKVILHNIETCHKTGKWYPLLLYYFSKNVGGMETSVLAADYEGWKDIKEEKTKEEETKVKSIENLF